MIKIISLCVLAFFIIAPTYLSANVQDPTNPHEISDKFMNDISHNILAISFEMRDNIKELGMRVAGLLLSISVLVFAANFFVGRETNLKPFCLNLSGNLILIIAFDAFSDYIFEFLDVIFNNIDQVATGSDDNAEAGFMNQIKNIEDAMWSHTGWSNFVSSGVAWFFGGLMLLIVELILMFYHLITTFYYAVFIALSPLLFALYILPSTRQYAKGGITLYVSAVTLKLLLALTIMMIAKIASEALNSAIPEDGGSYDPSFYLVVIFLCGIFVYFLQSLADIVRTLTGAHVTSPVGAAVGTAAAIVKVAKGKYMAGKGVYTAGKWAANTYKEAKAGFQVGKLDKF